MAWERGGGVVKGWVWNQKTQKLNIISSGNVAEMDNKSNLVPRAFPIPGNEVATISEMLKGHFHGDFAIFWSKLLKEPGLYHEIALTTPRRKY